MAGWKQVISTGTDHKQLLLNHSLWLLKTFLFSKKSFMTGCSTNSNILIFFLNPEQNFSLYNLRRSGEKRTYIYMYVYI